MPTPHEPSFSGQIGVAIALPDSTSHLKMAFQHLGVELTTSTITLDAQPSPEVVDFGHRLLTGGIDVVIWQSEFGIRQTIKSMTRSIGRDRFLESLSDIEVIAANEGVANQLVDLGISSRTARSPGGWRELLILLDTKYRVANLNIAVEQFLDERELAAGLESRGARLLPIPVLNGTQQDSQLAPDLLRNSAWVIIPSPLEAVHLLKSFPADRRRQLNNWMASAITLVGCHETQRFLARHLRTNFLVIPSIADLEQTPQQCADEVASKLNEERARIQIRLPQQGGDEPCEGAWHDSPFMKACRGEPTDVTPIWMMRQAGRYMQEYREVRAKVSFLDLCYNPQLCSEVMCTAVERLGVDAAIIFSDLLPILVPMGCDLEFVKGDGPVIHNPVRESSDIDRIRPLENLDELWFVPETVRQTRADLPEHLPLIGFAGAPFTLASYMIEGGASRNYEHTKRLMFGDQGAWHELMGRLADSISLYVQGQVDAGAQCIQLFDSWAGCLNYEDYRQYVLPYVQRIIASTPIRVPFINFATGNPGLLPLLADTQANVIGVDWRMRLDDAWQIVGHDRSVQGNLDPTVLLTDRAYIREAAQAVLEQAAGRPGHIFNLGHGILPSTPVDHAIALVDAVHELSSK